MGLWNASRVKNNFSVSYTLYFTVDICQHARVQKRYLEGVSHTHSINLAIAMSHNQTVKNSLGKIINILPLPFKLFMIMSLIEINLLLLCSHKPIVEIIVKKTIYP